MLRLYRYLSPPSLAVACKQRKRIAIRTHKPQALSDWLNPLSLGTRSAFGQLHD